MPHIRLRAPSTFESGFGRIRRELDVPISFPDDVFDSAEQARPVDVKRVDVRHIEFIAVDPPGATDLDQAFAAERLGDGYRVLYAIADVGAFVEPGGVIDLEARKRGATLYSPDLRTPLHPTIISEDRASLLPGTEKPALLWTIDLDGDGEATDWRLERALVRISESITYTEAQSRIDHPRADGRDAAMVLLAEIGQLRQQVEAARGGVSLALPAQEVVPHPEEDGRYTLEFDETMPVEGWNAQISLLTGIVAGTSMFDAGVGILRTLPPTRKQNLRKLRRQAEALAVDWPAELDYATFVRSIRPDSPANSAFLLQAARSFRGAGYIGFDDGNQPDHAEHGAIASIYAHVTAPLRRLVDRFGNEILLALSADETPPAWAIEALDELPSLMGRAASKDSALERAMVDFVEAMVLTPRVGSTFDGFVVDVDERRDRATVQIADPAIVTHIPLRSHRLAEDVRLRLDAVNPDERTITFAPI